MVNPAYSQQNTENDTTRKDALKLYISCSSCDFDFLRREITFVNFVREPVEAQVYLLITSQNTGSGGLQYNLFFIGQNEFKSLNDTLNFTVSPDNTSDEERTLMSRVIKIGLMHYITRTPVFKNIEINFTTEKKQEEVSDKWNNWVFRVSSTINGSFEKSYQSFSLNSSFSAEKVTESFKTEFYLSHYYSESHYLIENDIYKTFSRSFTFSNISVVSLGEHWSGGLSSAISSSLYRNIQYNHAIGPAIEYNLFPYAEASRRQLRIKYTVGHKFNRYFDTTLYGKISEPLFEQAIGIAYEIVQKWGSINLALQGSNYLHDFSKNNLYIYASARFRIVKGLSFSNFGWFTLSHDQIELPKYDATPEEVLLRIRELESQFNFYIYTGFTYTFGSIYNNVVNPRFGD
ncbi:MAG TPA: hypothetical protein P5050_01410 [Bacteroidia bacterium]|nr:hypothetical protein [Bacteroidia bacterium]HRS57859.1 hypothetical protein [Bacteroidia bacterium]HRU67801.1 hypothetical protein [Bacteroidia bacterium]